MAGILRPAPGAGLTEMSTDHTLEKIMTDNAPEPTDDDTPDGSQMPTADDLPDEEGDAGVGGVDLEDDAVLLSELPD